jgi:predicted metal-dependent peptidase
LPETVTFIQFDSEAGEPEVVERGEEPVYKRGRCGGTRFSAPFEKAEKLGILDDFDVIIVFTDGGADDFPEEPNCPVIWATTGAFWGGNPPFGEVVQVKFNR